MMRGYNVTLVFEDKTEITYSRICEWPEELVGEARSKANAKNKGQAELTIKEVNSKEQVMFLK